MFYSYIVLLIYVNETIYLLGNLPFFKIHVHVSSCFMAGMTHPVPVLSQKLVDEGLGATLSFETYPFSN